MSDKLINIGVVGVGHLGIHHAKHYSNISTVNLVGVYDLNFKRNSYVAKRYKTSAYTDLIKLIICSSLIPSK